MRRAHRRQVSTIPPEATGTGFLGASTLDPGNVAATASLLLDGTATGGAPAIPTSASTVASTPLSSDATSPTSEASQSSATSNSIPVGTVIGICVGVFAALSAVLLLVFYFGSTRRLQKQQRAKGTGKDAERRKSGRELWVKMEEKDGDGSYEKYAIKRSTMTSTAPSLGTSTTVIGRSITVKSAKSAKTFKSLGYGTNLGLSETFKTPDLPPHLEFTDADIGSGRAFVNSIGPAPFTRVENPPISWDGETIGEGASYLSLKHSNGSMQFANVNSPVSPNMVISYQTPPAVETKVHQWEEAEVVSPEGAEDAYGGVDEPHYPTASRSSQETVHRSIVQPQPWGQLQAESRNPFSDQNPFDDSASVLVQASPPSAVTSDSCDSFFSAQTDVTARTGAFEALTAVASHHERMDSNERAMASLIAALDISQEEVRERLSAAIMPTPRQSAVSGFSLDMQSVESRDSEADAVALDEASFKRFPLPPTDIEHHSAAP